MTTDSRHERDADQRAETPEASRRAGPGRAQGMGRPRQTGPASDDPPTVKTSTLMDQVVCTSNMVEAYQRVRRNGGAPGVDGMTIDETWTWCGKHWSDVRNQLLDGTYVPQPVRRVDIPKSGGGQRMLGIPTVLDRLIQQAMLQVLQPIFDPTFSESSFGFRPGRSAHQAVQAAQGHIADGHRWVIDMDLEKFFDRVNHDVLMARLARRIEDKRILKVVRAYLQAGMMDNGVATPRDQGTPQGGPISPLLSNVLLDELDRELEKRGHRFARYADDCNIYVRSKRAGRRVLDSITRYLETRLRLQVNDEKSAVDRPWNRTFLGYSFTWHRNPKPKVAPASVRRFKQILKEVFRWGRGRNIRQTIRHIVPKLRGWVAYFKLSEVKNVFERLDRWIRRRLRCILWRQWKRPKTRYQKLMACGLSASRAAQSAGNGHGPWWNAGASHMNYAVTTKRLRRCGLISLIDEYQRLEP